MACTNENTVNVVTIGNNTLCSCHLGYHGPTCDLVYVWYRPIISTAYIIEIVAMILMFIGVAAHLHTVRKRGRLQANLSTVGIGFSMLGFLLRAIHLAFIPSRTVWGSIEGPVVTYTTVTFVYSVISLWLTTCLLIVGFWHDALTHKLHPQLKTRTKVWIGLISSIVLLLMIAGMVLILRGMLIPGTVIVLIPFLAVIITIFVYTIKIKRIKGNFGSGNQERKQWIEKWTAILCGAWSFYLICLLAHPALTMAGLSYMIVIPSACYRLIECVISFALLSLFDVKYRSLKKNLLCCIYHNLDDGKSSTVMASTGATSSGAIPASGGASSATNSSNGTDLSVTESNRVPPNSAISQSRSYKSSE